MDSKRMKMEINDQLVCPVCSKNYEISGDLLPRIFMCNHSVCTKCIDLITFNSELICPTCKNQYTIPHGPESVPESATIINSLKALEENEEETGELCKEHQRELRHFCKGDHCKIAVCELCMLEGHNGHPAGEIGKEFQENIEVILECISKKKSEHTKLCTKDTNCMEGLKKMQTSDFIKFNNMINNVQEKVNLTEALIDNLDKESQNLLEMKYKVIVTGKASLEEMKSIRKAMNEGELLGSHSPPSTSGSLTKELCLQKSHEVSAFNLPTSRKVLFMEGLSDGTLAVCFEDYKEGEEESSKDYFLTQYHSKRFFVIDVKLAEKPSGMKEVTVGKNICLALSFRKQQKIVFRDITKLDEVFLSYSVSPHNPGFLCTESPTTLLFLDESSSPHQLKRLDLGENEKAITTHYTALGTGEKRRFRLQKPCEYKHLGCPRVLDNHSNYASHVRACSYRITDRPPKVQPCQYKHLGCPKVMSNRGNYKKHIGTCPYRMTDRPSKVLQKPCENKHLGCPKVITGVNYNYLMHVEACQYGKEVNPRKASKTTCKYADKGCPRVFRNTITLMKHTEECPYEKSPAQEDKIFCKYKENGCPKILDNQMKYLRHVRSCPFRFLPCQYANNGCSKVLDNQMNYTRHVNACPYKVNEKSEQVTDRTIRHDVHDGCPEDVDFSKLVRGIPCEGLPQEIENSFEDTGSGSTKILNNHINIQTCPMFDDKAPESDKAAFMNVNKEVLSNIKKETETCSETDKDVNDGSPEVVNFSELMTAIPYEKPLQDGNSFGYMGNEFPRVLGNQSYVEICPNTFNDETPEVDKTSLTDVCIKLPEISINYKKHTEASPENDKEELPQEAENALCQYVSEELPQGAAPCQNVNSGKPKAVDNFIKVVKTIPHLEIFPNNNCLEVLRNNKKDTEAIPENLNEESPREAAPSQNVNSGCSKAVDDFIKVVKTIPHMDACSNNAIEQSPQVANKMSRQNKVLIVLRKKVPHHK